MKVIQHFNHAHPLVFNEEGSHESKEVYCCACAEVVSGPRFSCVACGFHLDKNCAEAPSEMYHPFHRNHSLNLLVSSPYSAGNPICNFCAKHCEKFVYHCSCNINLHIKCALFSNSIFEKKFGEPQQISHLDLLISFENHSEELKNIQCFACWKPLLDSEYISPDCGFYLHKKCVELPLEINHLCHRHHSLFIQFNSDLLLCQICQEIQHQGLVYCCPICKFVLHIECVSPSPVIEDPSSHEHPFTRCLRNFFFNCDACGTLGTYVSYICSACSLIVHKKCISLPRIVKSLWHQHPVFHKYFVVDKENRISECVICHEEVNKECGSYYCSECSVIIHVNCALGEPWRYYKIESIDVYEKLSENAMLEANTMDPTFFVIKEIKLGENVINTEIKHFSHQHNLVLSEEIRNDRYCDGCSQLLTTSFYQCLQCDFCLHKSCAELSRKKLIWFHGHHRHQNFVSIRVFQCSLCLNWCSGFGYKCEEYLCSLHFCLRCAELPLTRTSQEHKHRLLHYYHCYWQYCNACGGSTGNVAIYRCKACNYNVHWRCTLTPQTARHKCDEHCLTLTYHEDNYYSEYLYCDICEKERSPNTWFYHCAICDTSAHPKCVLGDYPFIKRGIITIIESVHPHPLVFVQRVYHYPAECCKCGQPCLDLALECSDANCKYIIHWKCSTTVTGS